MSLPSPAPFPEVQCAVNCTENAGDLNQTLISWVKKPQLGRQGVQREEWRIRVRKLKEGIEDEIVRTRKERVGSGRWWQNRNHGNRLVIPPGMKELQVALTHRQVDDKESEKRLLGLEYLAPEALVNSKAGLGVSSQMQKLKWRRGSHCEGFDSRGGSPAKARSWSSVSSK